MKAILASLLMIVSCQKSLPVAEKTEVDVILIGAGIMSATLGSILLDLDPKLKMIAFERLEGVALESSAVWNNAGTGHSAYCELNYTPEKPDGSIDIKKALEVGGAFELSRQYWAYLAEQDKSLSPESFIRNVPHISFVWGDKNTSFLKKRYAAMVKHPFFKGMEYSEDHGEIAKWIPLVMKGRDQKQKIAATRMQAGTDVNFEALTRGMFNRLKKDPNFELYLRHEVVDLVRNDDQTWTVVVSDDQHNTRTYKTKFVFVGAGGAALSLLQKSGIEEGKGFGGFPVGGAWLVTENKKLIDDHNAKVYGQASVGAPPMSVPHLDTRYINGKRSLLFGPFATFSTKFLKNGSWVDLPASVSFSNLLPMIQVGFHNLDLVSYLIGQVMMSKESRIESLKEYMPEARIEDWQPLAAGQRVQIIKDDKEKGGVLQFGTEVVGSKDGSIVALLGASPGASIVVSIMLQILEKSFKDKLSTEAWQKKLKEMIPSYGQDLLGDEKLLRSVQERDRQLLKLAH